MVRLKRTVRGWYIVGRRRFVTVKWLRPGVVAIRAGIRTWQVGRLPVRVSRTLAEIERAAP